MTDEGAFWATKHSSFYVGGAECHRPRCHRRAGNAECGVPERQRRVRLRDATGCNDAALRSKYIAFRNPSGETIVIVVAQNTEYGGGRRRKRAFRANGWQRARGSVAMLSTLFCLDRCCDVLLTLYYIPHVAFEI